MAAAVDIPRDNATWMNVPPVPFLVRFRSHPSYFRYSGTMSRFALSLLSLLLLLSSARGGERAIRAFLSPPPSRRPIDTPLHRRQQLLLPLLMRLRLHRALHGRTVRVQTGIQWR